jgi:Fe-S cluster assembly scaffold protein SufB
MAQADSFSQSDASQSASDAQVRADIDSGEAFTSATVNDTRSWNINNKRLYDVYQQLDLKSAQAYADLDLTRARNAQTMWENTYSELLKDQAEMRRRSMNQFDNTVVVEHQENQRTVRQGDIAADRMWNIDEVAHLVKEIMTEDQPFKDAISASVIQAIAGMAKDKA